MTNLFVKMLPTLALFLLQSAASGLEQRTRTEIVIFKAQHLLKLYVGGRETLSFQVALGKTVSGAKHCEGDGKTPEGTFVIDARLEKSSFHRALHVSYPQPADRDLARALRCPPGGQIMIHGIKNGLAWLGSFHRLIDWTDGCIALTNSEVDELWKLAPVGTIVVIKS